MAVRRIWLCADDYGIAPGVNAAIRDLIGRKRINATSVMVSAPSFDREAIDALAAVTTERQAAIGLHVTLTAPFSPLIRSFSPLRRSVFLPLGRMLVKALLRQLDRTSLASEVEAQFAAFERAFGRPPDFIDGHQHVQLFPQVRDAVLAATKARAPDAWVRQCASVRSWPVLSGDPKGLLINALSRDFRERAATLGIPTNPAFAGTYSYQPGADFGALFLRFIKGLPDGGLIMCHPGTVDEKLRALDPLTQVREREYGYLVSEQFREMLAAAEVELI